VEAVGRRRRVRRGLGLRIWYHHSGFAFSQPQYTGEKKIRNNVTFQWHNLTLENSLSRRD
jgi:chemotaxis methyl-accepting protein methylase